MTTARRPSGVRAEGLRRLLHARPVHNVHERYIPAPVEKIGALIDSLASADDRLWPHAEWPPLRLDRPLGVGAAGGHGPVRYFVTQYEPGRRVEFRFTGPSGFDGQHAFSVVGRENGITVLRHQLSMVPRGMAMISWPLFFRPLHDALLEESFDRAERACGTTPIAPAHRTLWTRILRSSFVFLRFLRRRHLT